MADEEQQSMTSASTTDYTAASTPSNNKGSGSSSKQQNNTLNAIKTAVPFGSTTKDTSTSKDADSGQQKMGSPERKLSMVSRMYDIDGDGQLGKCVYYDCNISLFVHIMC